MRTILFVNTIANEYGRIGAIIRNYANLFPNDKIISIGDTYDKKNRANFPNNVETIRRSEVKNTIICDIVFFTMAVDFKRYEKFIPINIPKILMFHIDVSKISKLPLSPWYDYNLYTDTVKFFDAITVSSPSYIPIARELFPEVDVFEFKNYTNFSKVEECNRKNFLYLGRIAKNSKNTFELIKIAKLLRGKNIIIDVYGSGTDKKLFEKKVKEEKLEDIIKIKGHLDQELVLQTISQYKALLNTSYLECFPYVALEAFYTNTPVIAYNCSPGIYDILSDNRGILIEAGDYASYATAMLQFSSEIINYKSMQQYISEFSYEKIEHQIDFFTSSYDSETVVIIDEYNKKNSNLCQFIENSPHTKFVVLYNQLDGRNNKIHEMENVKMYDYRIHDEYYFYIMEKAKYIINSTPHLVQKVPIWIREQLLIHNKKTMHLYFGNYENLYEDFDSFISNSQTRQALENSFITRNVFVKNENIKKQLANVLGATNIYNLPNFINVQIEQNYDIFERNDICYIAEGNISEENFSTITEISKYLDNNIKINIYGEVPKKFKDDNVNIMSSIDSNNIVHTLAKHKALISITPPIDYTNIELETKLANTPCVFCDTSENIEEYHKLFAKKINEICNMEQSIQTSNYKYDPTAIAYKWDEVFKNVVCHQHNFEEGITFIVDDYNQNLNFDNYQIIGTQIKNYNTKIKFNKITRLFDLPTQEKIDKYIIESSKNVDIVLFEASMENIHVITLYNSICSVESLLDNMSYLNYNASKYFYDVALTKGLRNNALSLKQNELRIDLKYILFEKLLVHSWFCNRMVGINREALFTKRTLVNKENVVLYEQYRYILRRREKNVFI